MGYEAENNYGEATRANIKAFDDFDWSNPDARDEYMQTAKNYISFPEGLKQFIDKKYGEIPEDKLHTFIEECSQKRGVDLPMPTVKNWLSSDKKEKRSPQGITDSRTRNNMYKLCFALGFTVKETREFFRKVYLVRPYDSRDIKEAVYLFCMNNNNSYEKALDLISIIESGNNAGQETDGEMKITKTRVLNLKILEIKNEKDFLAFMDTNRNSFGLKNNTARQYYTKLLEDAKEMAGGVSKTKLLDIILYGPDLVESEERDKGADAKKIAKVTSNTEVFDINLFGSDPEDNEKKFLKVVKRNFPQKQQLSEIEQGTASYDTIRKALILLKFYTFFMHVGENNAYGDHEDFYQETDDMLVECGYSPLYPRNPYDWIFMYCAHCSHDPKNRDIETNQPLVELTDIMNAFSCA